MYKISFTKTYRIWYRALADVRARVKIDLRLNSVRKGNLGVTRSIGDGIFELKIDYGQGYRIYCKTVKSDIVVLLCGGDKSTQEADIEKAKKLVEELENGTK